MNFSYLPPQKEMSAERKSSTKRKSFLLKGHGCRHRTWLKTPTVPQRLEPQGSDDFKMATQPCYYGVDASVSVFPSDWRLNEWGVVEKKNASVPSIVRREPNARPSRRELSSSQAPIDKSHNSRQSSNGVTPKVPQSAGVVYGQYVFHGHRAAKQNAIPGKSLGPKDASHPTERMSGTRGLDSTPDSLSKLTLREDGPRPTERLSTFSNSSTEPWLSKGRRSSHRIDDGTDAQRKTPAIPPVIDANGQENRLLPNKRLLVPAERRETAKRPAIAAPPDGPNKIFVRSMFKALQGNRPLRGNGPKSKSAFLDHIRLKMIAVMKNPNCVKPATSPPVEKKKIPQAPPRVDEKSQLKDLSKVDDPKPRAAEIRKKMNEHLKSKNASNISRPKPRGPESRKSTPIEVSKDTSQVEVIWKRWNAVLGRENPDVGKLMADAKIFEGLSTLLSHCDAKKPFPSKLVIDHYLLWPAGSYCFSRLISIIEEEAEASDDDSSESIRFKTTASVLNRLMSYMVNLAASALRISTEAAMKQRLFDAVGDFAKRTRHEGQTRDVQLLPRSLKDLAKIAMREQDKNGRNCEIWKEIRIKATSAFKDLKKLSDDRLVCGNSKIPPKSEQDKSSPASADLSIPKKVPSVGPAQKPTVSSPPAPRAVDSPRGSGAGAGWTKKKKKTVQFGNCDPTLDKTIRARPAKVDKETYETSFMDSSRIYDSILLDPINAAQEEAVTERLSELSLGGAVKFFGMLSEYIRGCERVHEIEQEIGSVPSLLPPTAVYLADVRKLKVIGTEIEREIKERRLPGY